MQDRVLSYKDVVIYKEDLASTEMSGYLTATIISYYFK